MVTFTCCGITFEGEAAYVEHRQKIHGEQPAVKHTCCGIKFYTDEGYREHRQNIHGESAVEERGSVLSRLFKWFKR